MDYLNIVYWKVRGKSIHFYYNYFSGGTISLNGFEVLLHNIGMLTLKLDNLCKMIFSDL